MDELYSLFEKKKLFGEPYFDSHCIIREFSGITEPQDEHDDVTPFDPDYDPLDFNQLFHMYFVYMCSETQFSKNLSQINNIYKQNWQL